MDWNEVKVQAAIACLPKAIESAEFVLKQGQSIGGQLHEVVAKLCCEYADALVKELKEGNIEKKESDLFDHNINELLFISRNGTRLYNYCKSQGMTTIGELLRRSSIEVMKERNIGSKTIRYARDYFRYRYNYDWV